MEELWQAELSDLLEYAFSSVDQIYLSTITSIKRKKKKKKYNVGADSAQHHHNAMHGREGGHQFGLHPVQAATGVAWAVRER